MKALTSFVVSGLFVVAGPASAVTFDGIDFPDGASSFADAVESYAPGANVSGVYDDPTQALGAPDGSFTSLGAQGTLILEFSDNSLTASGDTTSDLHVFETGAATEAMEIAISADASDWIDLGTLSGQPTSIDIDPVSGVTVGTPYSFVRLIDDASGPTGGPFAGADIDAVGAISSAPPAPESPAPIPLPAGVWLLGAALGGLGLLRRR